MLKRFLVFYFSIFFYVFLSVFGPLAWAEAKPSISEKCSGIAEELKARSQTLEKMSASLDSLLGSSQNYEMPIQVIFQVDLKNPEMVQKRIKELSQKLEPASVLSAFTPLNSASCDFSEIKEVLLEFIQEQSKINEKKVEFLKIDSEKRNALLSSYESNRKKATDQYGIENQLSASKAALNLAQQNLNKTESNSSVLEPDKSEATTVAQSSVDKFNIDIETEHIRFVESLKAKGATLEKLQEDLAQFSKNTRSSGRKKVSENYKFVSEIWTLAADGILELFRDVKLESEIQMPEMFRVDAYKEAMDIEDTEKLEYKKYSDSYVVAQNRQKLLAQTRTKMLNDLKIKDFKILNDSGSLRAQFLRECDRLECQRPRGLNEENLTTLWREVKIVPLKLVAGGLGKWIEVKAKITSGFDGWIDLSKQILLLFLLFLIPFFLIKSLSWVSERLETIKKNLLSRSMIDYRSRTGLAVWISRINPFVPSLGMILSIGLARYLVGKTDLSEIAGLLFYFQIYFVYRAARLLLMIGFEVIFSTHSVDVLKLQKERIEKTATRVAKLIFIQYILLHLTEDSVRRALAYQFFSSIIFWVNIAFVFLEGSKWRVEIYEAFNFRFPKVMIKARSFYESRAGELLLPFMFISVILQDLLKLTTSYLIRVDLVKKLLSEVLRKRLEGVEKKTSVGGSPPQEYLNFFDYYLSANDQIFIEPEEAPVRVTTLIIEDWLRGKPADDLIIIVGNRGMGKTTTLHQIHKRLQQKCQASWFPVPPKVTTEKDLFLWISKALSEKIDSIDDFKNLDHNLKQKMVFCVDDIQNFFLGTIGGFAAYKIFLEIISLKTKNIYWCLTVNSRSWSYLKGVFGKEHFYGKILNLIPWKDFEIQKLILVRHQQTQFNRSFDETIKAYGAGDSLGQQAEAQFFRLLWGQSRGNPRSALMYWISAIHYPSPKNIHVGIPSFISSSTVGTMSDDAHFILSLIARHESLTHEELKHVSGIHDTVIRKCLKEAVDKSLIWIDDSNRVRISSRAQYVIDYFLIGKNFLYE